MNRGSMGKWASGTLLAGLLLGCGGAGEEAPATEPTSASTVRAQGRSCDPQTACVVGSRWVSCNSGPQMAAYWTDDGYCIERNVCDRYGGPTVCPYE